MLNSLDNELIITGDVEEGSAGSGVGQLDQWLVTQRVLQEKEECISISQTRAHVGIQSSH